MAEITQELVVFSLACFAVGLQGLKKTIVVKLWYKSWKNLRLRI